MHPLQVVAKCTFVDEVSRCIGGLGLCTRTSVPLTSLRQINYQLLGHLIDEVLVTLQLARCIFEGAIWHLAPLSTDEALQTGVLLFGTSGHGRLRPRLWAFRALLGGGILAFERGGGGLNTLMSLRKCTLNLGAGGTQEGKEAQSAFTAKKNCTAAQFWFTRVYRQKKNYTMGQFFCTHVFCTMGRLFCTRVYHKKKLHDFTAKKKYTVLHFFCTRIYRPLSSWVWTSPFPMDMDQPRSSWGYGLATF